MIYNVKYTGHFQTCNWYQLSKYYTPSWWVQLKEHISKAVWLGSRTDNKSHHNYCITIIIYNYYTYNYIYTWGNNSKISYLKDNDLFIIWGPGETNLYWYYLRRNKRNLK